jgi:hypothetical protein
MMSQINGCFEDVRDECAWVFPKLFPQETRRSTLSWAVDRLAALMLDRFLALRWAPTELQLHPEHQ